MNNALRLQKSRIITNNKVEVITKTAYEFNGDMSAPAYSVITRNYVKYYALGILIWSKETTPKHKTRIKFTATVVHQAPVEAMP